MGAGAPADIRRAQSGPVPCSGARRRGKVLDEASAAIPRDAVARNIGICPPFKREKTFEKFSISQPMVSGQEHTVNPSPIRYVFR